MLDALRSGEVIQRQELGQVLVNDAWPGRYEISTPIRMETCVIESFMAVGLHLEQQLQLRACEFNTFTCESIVAAGGVRLRDCVFHGPFSFACGGYNEHPFVIEQCRFEAFADFFDCVLGEVIVTGSEFCEGTNLLQIGGETGVQYTGALPRLERNLGIPDRTAD